VCPLFNDKTGFSILAAEALGGGQASEAGSYDDNTRAFHQKSSYRYYSMVS
jgi:hypothetical protein